MDLDLKRVLAARPDAPRKSDLAPLTTVWGDSLDCSCVLSEHPRPQLERDTWVSLNGWWEYAIRESSDAQGLWPVVAMPTRWDGKILVPFSPESVLSGVGRQLLPNQLLWYRREVDLKPCTESRRLLLHFEAVDYCCAVYVNGIKVCEHRGGYLPFDTDITDVVRAGVNAIVLCVWDPSESGTQLRGKQRIVRGNMWYTAQSGIWQSVWLEEVEATRIVSLEPRAHVDAAEFEAVVCVSEPGGDLLIEVIDAAGNVVSCAQTVPEETTVSVWMQVYDIHLWSPDKPYLYGIRATYANDEVRSYCAFRVVGIERDERGIARFCLNHKPLFVRGVLDQGYWPDGLMTAPSDEALVADIEFVRAAGFNMLRKHIKVESRRWYYHCDRLGILVWQDMVSGGGLPGEWTSANIPTLVRRSWSIRDDRNERSWRRFGAGDAAYRHEWLETARQTIELLRSHPCIATWVVFNESWGQFSSQENCDQLRSLDKTRPFIATSGWYDQGAGDYYAVHNYFRSMRVYKDPHAGLFWRRKPRAFILDEFGGLTCPVEGHVSVPDITYGYDAFDDVDEWRHAVSNLLAEVDALEEEGLVGYVYTQLSDVEEETNGLLTYDRRVNKFMRRATAEPEL